MNQQELKNKLRFFKFLTMRLSRGDVYPHFIEPENFSRNQIMRIWEEYAVSVKNKLINKNLGIFIKIPFCQNKCFYCQCYSQVVNNSAQIERYVNYLAEELNSYATVLKDIKIDSLYFGGGTPSILSPEQIKKIFAAFYKHWRLEPTCQINFEATPFSLDEKKLQVLKEYGVNRVTLGVQSMDDQVLKVNNRAFQNKESVARAIQLVRKFNIQSLNIDLIGGLYGQSYDSFMDSLRQTITFMPEMIHIYPFSASAETLFSKSGKKMSQADLALRHRMIEDGNALILKSGYQEIANDSFGLSNSDRNKQEADNVEVNAAILALGDKARGHIFGKLIYQIEDFSGQIYAKGVKVDVEDEIIKYLIYNLRNPIDLKKILGIFPGLTLAHLKNKLKYLILFKKIKLANDTIIPLIKTRQEQLIYSKFLYRDDYLDKLSRYFAPEFSASTDYNNSVNYLIDEIQ